jgi:hypothetical protein
MEPGPFADSPPAGDRVTDYDLAHLALYLKLLDAHADAAASWEDAVQLLFGIDPAAEPKRARIVHESHLARAQWMTRTGYRQLAARSLGEDT